MKRIYSSVVLADVKHRENLLAQAGIDCVVRNEQLAGALGEVPFLECEPELWVADEQLERAQAVLAGEREAPGEDALPWRCSRCGEINEPQFGACWQCNEAAP